MTVDPFDLPDHSTIYPDADPAETKPTELPPSAADRPSVFIKSVTAQVLTKSPESYDETNGPDTEAPTLRPLSEGWTRSESDWDSRPSIEFREKEASDFELMVLADQDGVYIAIGDNVIAMKDKRRVERLLHTIERAWDDHEFLFVMKEKDGADTT